MPHVRTKQHHPGNNKVTTTQKTPSKPTQDEPPRFLLIGGSNGSQAENLIVTGLGLLGKPLVESHDHGWGNYLLGMTMLFFFFFSAGFAIIWKIIDLFFATDDYSEIAIQSELYIKLLYPNAKQAVPKKGEKYRWLPTFLKQRKSRQRVEESYSRQNEQLCERVTSFVERPPPECFLNDRDKQRLCASASQNLLYGTFSSIPSCSSFATKPNASPLNERARYFVDVGKPKRFLSMVRNNEVYVRNDPKYSSSPVTVARARRIARNSSRRSSSAVAQKAIRKRRRNSAGGEEQNLLIDSSDNINFPFTSSTCE